jgi:hypothetical protein
MDEVAAAAAHHSVGRRVKARPGQILRVRRQGSEELLPRTMKVADAPPDRMMGGGRSHFVHGVLGIDRQQLQHEVAFKIRTQGK